MEAADDTRRSCQTEKLDWIRRVCNDRPKRANHAGLYQSRRQLREERSAGVRAIRESARWHGCSAETLLRLWREFRRRNAGGQAGSNVPGRKRVLGLSVSQAG